MNMSPGFEGTNMFEAGLHAHLERRCPDCVGPHHVFFVMVNLPG